MFDEKFISLGRGGNPIRELQAYGVKRAQEIGRENVFDFTMGNPSVDPPACVHETIKRLIDTRPAMELHSYAPAAGLPGPKAKVADYLTSTYGVKYEGSDIFFTMGASAALCILSKALTTPGDEAIGVTPFFMDYSFYAKTVGVDFKAIPSTPGDFQIDVEALEAAVTEKTAYMIVNSPNNPSGIVLTRENLEQVVAVLEKKQQEYGHAIYLIADEPYRELLYGGAEVSFLPAMYRNTIYVYSFSKSLSMPGDRIGFIAVNKNVEDYDRVMEAIGFMARTYGNVCLSPLMQMVAAECIGQTADVSKYEDNRNLLYNALSEMGFEFVRPDGAFYLFIKSPEADSMAFCKKAMLKDILLVPGDTFFYPGYARLAYCVSYDTISRSLPKFRELAKEYGLVSE